MWETTRAQLQMAQDDQLDLHTLPQGVMTFLLEAQADGKVEIRSEVGLGTMLDPRVGLGSRVLKGSSKQFVRADNDALILYHAPDRSCSDECTLC
ncbi:MAG: hypothetical protein IPJ06_03015 [Saprospiraceae bacterium]|nr:hypothetical protein [Saprospiraceae bacterium]